MDDLMDITMDGPNEDKKTKKKKNEAWEWIKSLLIAFGLALLIRFFLFAIFMVEGQSMFPTLHDTERLVVNKIVYEMHEPERGDIIVFEYPQDREKDFVKRVIGVPGDKIEIKDYKVFRNGEPIEEPYISEPTAPTNITYTVPDGTVFVLGDNRPHSKDSRYPEVGYVPYDLIIGRAELVWWPLSAFRLL